MRWNSMKLLARGKEINLSRTLIMAILNVTPDSFSDGGKFMEKSAALARALDLKGLGADIIDIGGESTRPGARTVTSQEEISRIIPVIQSLKRSGSMPFISIDTYKSTTARAALEAGADIINDISGGTFDPDIIKVVSEFGAGFVITHINGTPKDMQNDPVYSSRGAAYDIAGYFRKRLDAAAAGGIPSENIILDPGIGFGKTLADNFDIINNIQLFKVYNRPVLIGTSRKSMIGEVTGASPEDRIFGTAAMVALAVEKGADIIRVHDVREMKQAAQMAFALAGHGIWGDK
jgi:dihydropteroate synthase